MSQIQVDHTDDGLHNSFLVLLILLLGLGTVMVFTSTGATRTLEVHTDFLVKHLLFLGLSGFVFITILQFQSRRILQFAPWLYLLGLLLLLLVLIPGLGVQVNGARRWFRLGPVSFQPSELMKILMPLMLAWLTRASSDGKCWWSVIVSLLVLLLTPFLVALEPDLGTAVLLFCLGACYLYLAGSSIKLFLIGLVSLAPALLGLMHYRPYQWNRVIAYLDAIGNWEQAHYQVKQSLLSIGSGGWWGTGLGQGLQKLSYLPESHTDFVFAVIGEELGLCGALLTIALWLLLLLCGFKLTLRISSQTEDFALAGTLLIGVILQAAINICVVTSMLPPKGISHPLLSYGGSNLLATMIALAIVLNLTQQPMNSQRTLVRQSEPSA